jgi:DNA-binding response OmpR family regulator
MDQAIAVMTASGDLDGCTVLLVEDESLVSLLAEDILTEAGCTVLLAMRLREALQLAQSAEFDLAVLDVNLGGGETSYPVAEILRQRNIPFLFATGYDAAALPAAFRDAGAVQKPYRAKELLTAAAAIRPARR